MRGRTEGSHRQPRKSWFKLWQSIGLLGSKGVWLDVSFASSAYHFYLGFHGDLVGFHEGVS